MNRAIAKALKRIAPDIDFDVDWERDPYFVWDGDGPDPADEGYVAYDFTVFVSADGRDGRAGLGGIYARPGEFGRNERNVSGYLPQLLREALEELLAQSVSGEVKKQGARALDYLSRRSAGTHAAAQRQHRQRRY